MSRDLDIAVVTVTYKTAALAIEALRSVASERGPPGLNIRAIVVDNSSEDLPIIARSVETHGWRPRGSPGAAPRNGGYGYGNNLGTRHAYRYGSPAYVYLLNPDAQVRPGAIATLIEFLESRPDVGIVGSGFE